MTIQTLAELRAPLAAPIETDESPSDLPLVAARRREASATKPLPPVVRFTSPAQRARTVRDAERARAIVLFVPCSDPGKLGASIDADMEAVLASRGAMPTSLPEGASMTAIIEDQINRAAALPVRGICLCLPKLSPSPSTGLLDDADATVLSEWVDAARRERRTRLVVLFDEADRGLSLRVPVSLEALLGPSAVAETPAPPRVASAPAVELPDLPTEALAEPPSAPPPPVAETLRPPPSPRFEGDLEIEASVVVSRRTTAYRVDEGLEDEDHAEERGRAAERADAERLVASQEAAAKRAAEQAEAERLEVERAARMMHTATWRTFAMELDAARGPKPVAAVEKLYAQRYVPLVGAVARGEADAAVEGVVSSFRSSFAESYEASFGSVKVTAKRPPMVMDAPEVAQRVARLSSARSVKLILVDSMSYDLAERVSARIGTALDKRAVLVEKSILWSALPSTTPVQMHLLARGVEGLKDIPGPVSEPEVARGRTVSSLRRERLGAREVLKLDLVEARLRGPGPAYDERLDAIADEVAHILVKLLESFPARTLAYVFGDHGFCLGAGANGWATGPATQGGASPEEVLVAGHGWLLDAVQ